VFPFPSLKFRHIFFGRTSSPKISRISHKEMLWIYSSVGIIFVHWFYYLGGLLYISILFGYDFVLFN